MKHLRADYMRIQDPALHDGRLLSKGSTAIGADEPVFLLRGKDRIAPDAVRYWAESLIRITDPPSGDRVILYQAAMKWAAEMEEWQRAEGSKIPDTPLSELPAATYEPEKIVGPLVSEEPADGPGPGHGDTWQAVEPSEDEGETEEVWRDDGDVRVTVELPVSHAADLIATIARCVSANRIEYNYEETTRRPRRGR